MMWKPRWHGNMVFTWVRTDDERWLIVFQSKMHRINLAHALMRKLPVTTCIRLEDSYVADDKFAAYFAWANEIHLREREGRPRVGDAVFILQDKGDNQNGNITAVGSSYVAVTFNDGERREFTYEELVGRWTDKFRGCYYLEEGFDE